MPATPNKAEVFFWKRQSVLSGSLAQLTSGSIFGCDIQVYLNNELYTYGQYRDGGIEDLFNRCLELMTKNIERVEKFGISEESEFWDTVHHSYDWIPPLNLEKFKKYCTSI